jgi:hypothetical protein
MGKLEKLLEKFSKRPKTFKFTELKSLLIALGYKEFNKGKTSGSRVAYFNETTQHIIRLHKPNPGNELKKYVIDQIYDELSAQGYLK